MTGMRRLARWLVAVALALGLLLAALVVAKRQHLRSRIARWLRSDSAQADAPKAPPFSWPRELKVDTWLYRDGFVAPAADWGWSVHEPGRDGSLRVALGGWGGLRVAGAPSDRTYGGLTFRYRVPRLTDRIRVQLGADGDVQLPEVVVEARYERSEGDGWVRVYVPISVLNPDDHGVSHLVLMAARELPPTFIEFNDLGLVRAEPRSARRAPTRPVSMAIECDAATTVISPRIYGIGMAQDQPSDDVFWSGATIRRWGGNPTSRYNWKLGNAWNTASDWFFENVDYVGKPGYSYRTFLDNNAAHGLETALTLPMLGWVAKDIASSGFPRAKHPEQDSFDGFRPESGNGMRDGAPLPSGHPSRTSVAAPPSFIAEWVSAIRAEDRASGARSVHQYILDNEPNLWNHTHRDVHPEPLTYDELLERTIAYGSAVRAADPGAVIAGPAEWGFSNYFYSAKDAALNFKPPLDRMQHGMVALVPWYLRKLAEHEQKTGVRILDVLDLHFYPEKVYGPLRDRASAALRLRSTRSLWDPTYREESWIAEPVRLLPRMREWVNENYPGLGISIGEWNFGAERHMSGGLAVAEVLGRFGTHGVSSAYYWTYPAAGSPAAWAFRAYRNFDGQGAHFESLSVPASAGEQSSLFASRAADGRRWVLVALNFDPDSGAEARLKLGSCVPNGKIRAFAYAGERAGLVPTEVVRARDALTLTLPPYGMAVIEVVATE